MELQEGPVPLSGGLLVPHALEANRDSVSYTPLSEDGRGWVVPPPLAGASGRPGRSQLSRCMELPAPWCRTFREIFLHLQVIHC